MNKIEFSKLSTKEDMILAFNQLKDDYRQLFAINEDLQEENERLKEENKRIFSKVNDDELLISNAMNYAEAQDYKSRISKAIKYINKYFIFEDTGACYQSADFDSTNAKELYDILGGDDNE